MAVLVPAFRMVALPLNAGVCKINMVPKCSRQKFPIQRLSSLSRSDLSSMRTPLSDDTRVVLVGLDKDKTEMSFAELRELAKEQAASKGKELIQVRFKGTTQVQKPSFKLLTVDELEVTTRMARKNKANFSLIKVSIEGDEIGNLRVKEKQLTMKHSIGQADFETNISRIQKFLKKGNFVRLTIVSGGNAKAGKDLDQRVRNHLKDLVSEEELKRFNSKIS